MKLSDHTEHIRKLIDSAFRNRLGRMGITANQLSDISSVQQEYLAERKRIETIREVWIAETGTVVEAYEKLVEEFTFTLFNRLSALKVMEAHTLHPEIVTRRSQHGDRSFAHKHWLEQNPEGRNEEMEGLVRFMDDQLAALASDIPLFSTQHPYHLLPTAIELNGIMNAFNQVETDDQVEDNIWQSDDVLGWLYESYNNYKKAAHKESGDKTEFNKVSIQSQVYTPRWVVKFLVDNSLGKLYLEMYPDSDIKNRYKIANAPKTRTREPKQLTEIRMIDPATGSGNFLLYGFDLFYDLYTDQIENYGADYDDRKIAELIIANNLHGVDLDDRAIQLAQLGLYIKAKRKKRSSKVEHFNIVSSDFYLPEYTAVKHLFENEQPLSPELEKIVIDLWGDLQQAYKFGALIRLEEKFSSRLRGLIEKETKGGLLFSENTMLDYENFRLNFFTNLQKAVEYNTAKQGQTFLNIKTQDAITFLKLLTQKYDLAVANPPYTDTADFGDELKTFIDNNYKQPLKFNSNLYASFILRCTELINNSGIVGMIHPLTFMYIKSFEDVRKYILNKYQIRILVEFGMGGLFPQNIFVDPAFYILENNKNNNEDSLFVSLDQYSNTFNQSNKKEYLFEAIDNLNNGKDDNHLFIINQELLKIIEGWPFIYWISKGFRNKFKGKLTKDILDNCQGMATTDNNRFIRFWWEVDRGCISEDYLVDNKKWVRYIKGGPYNKWYGNDWTVVNYKNNGEELINLVKGKYPKISDPEFVIKNKKFYFKAGINYTASGARGASFRYHEVNHIFDVGGASIFPTTDFNNLFYILAFFNTNLCSYIINCLNPTVNTQSGDIERVPFVIPDKDSEKIVSDLSEINISIKKEICGFHFYEFNYDKNPIMKYKDKNISDRLFNYLVWENSLITQVLINESIIESVVSKVYELSKEDLIQISQKKGVLVGSLPVAKEAKNEFLKFNQIDNLLVRNFITELPEVEIEIGLENEIKVELETLYQSSNNIDDLCSRLKINPINAWYLFNKFRVIPKSRTNEIIVELLTDVITKLLLEDDDGIIPVVALPGEPSLLNRIEEYFLNLGFTSAQFMQIQSIFSKELSDYILNIFFKDFSNLLNLYRFLPKTPFIWHLSSGEHQGFEAYIIIYKWNRDSLYKLKSSYLSKRTESLQYRLQQIVDSTTGQAQTEKETIRLQLQEIEAFAKKIDELIAEGYDPKLDDGVGKNIAPLQAKGMLKAEVLKTTGGQKSQLNKYLNADW